MANIKEREQKILEYMKTQIRTKGYPPTVREICDNLEIKSTSTVHKDIESLVRQGFLIKDPSKPRALMVVADPKEKSQYAERTDIVDIPMVGRVAAGTPILAEENVEDTFPLPARFMGKGTNFMLTVRGDSMIEAGIFDGDYILIDGFEIEATVKTFYNEGDHIRLQPENPSMSPIIVNDVTILGKVKGVFRYF